MYIYMYLIFNGVHRGLTRTRPSLRVLPPPVSPATGEGFPRTPARGVLLLVTQLLNKRNELNRG